MLRRDYIQRMIEEFSRVIAHALGLKSSGRDEEALQELREAYRTWFALDADMIASLTPEEFLARLEADENFPPQKIEAVARGLMAEADLLSPADPAGGDRRMKALALFRWLEKNDAATFSIARRSAIASLEKLLGGT